MRAAALVVLLAAAPAFAALRAGAAKRVITPDLEKFAPVYMAGFGHNRRATSIHDDLWARCFALGTERLPLGELRANDRGQDPVREELEESIGRGEPRPLTREEREAAARDLHPGPAKTVYAPATERVAKPPLPADERLIDRHEEDAGEQA